MSVEYQGKSDQEIISAMEADLNAKSDPSNKEKFNTGRGALAQESGVDDNEISGKFPGAEVHVGRTGQTGGGTNPQQIPVEEGGDKFGTRSNIFENAPAGETIIDRLAQEQPGALNTTNRSSEAMGTRDQPAEPQLVSQEEGTMHYGK